MLIKLNVSQVNETLRENYLTSMSLDIPLHRGTKCVCGTGSIINAKLVV